MVIPGLIYIPFVQNYVVEVVTREIGKSTGLNIEVGRLNLRFPLSLGIDDAVIKYAKGDTMLTSSRINIEAKIFPLITGRVEVKEIGLDRAFFQLGNIDSIMWLRAEVNHIGLLNSKIDFIGNNLIDLFDIKVDGVDIWMQILENSTNASIDTTETSPWLIKIGQASVHNITYRLSMPPMIDSLGCSIGNIELRNGYVDLSTKSVLGQGLRVDSIDATYIYTPLANNSVVETSNSIISSSIDDFWTISADVIELNANRGLYALKGHKPTSGFDSNWIEVNDVTIQIDSFYNKGTAIRIPLKNLTAQERCGLQLHADGLFELDTSKMAIRDFSVETLRSSLSVNAEMGLTDITATASDVANIPLLLNTSGLINPKDIALAYPNISTMITSLPCVAISADMSGDYTNLDVNSIDLRISKIGYLKIEGEIGNPMNPEKIAGDLTVSGQISDMIDKQFAFLPIKQIPAIEIDGSIEWRPQRFAGDFALSTHEGQLTGSGRWFANRESYSATLHLDDFPIDEFTPECGLGKISATATIDGRGYNLFNNATYIETGININNIIYHKQTYNDISFVTSLSDGIVNGTLRSNNHDADLSADFNAKMNDDTVNWSVFANVGNINLKNLGFTSNVNQGSFGLNMNGYYNTASMDINADIAVNDIAWNTQNIDIISPTPIKMSFNSCDSLFAGELNNGDLKIKLNSQSSLFSVINQFYIGLNEITAQIDSMRIDVDSIHKSVPQFDMLFDMGKNNLLSKYLNNSVKIGFNNFTAGIHNDSLLWMNTTVNGFSAGTTRVDTISFNAVQHGQFLIYKTDINNRPGTFDEFAHVGLNGFAGANRFAAYFRQHNIKGDKGFNFGLSAGLTDSVITVKLVPSRPTIAYKPWSLNKDNYISYNLATGHLDASLLLSGENSSVNIFTEHTAIENSVRGELFESQNHSDYDDLVVKISNIPLQEWLSINPFAPPIKGDLNADMRIRYADGIFTGKGDVGLVELFFGKDRVGDFNLDVDVAQNRGGKLMANIGFMVDSIKTITAHGVLNDTASNNPFLLDFNMIQFPLHVVNPFIPSRTASLSGLLNGEMEITGTLANPIFNGSINFDTTEVKVKMLGASFKFSNKKIPVDSNIISFNDFTVLGSNKNPLYVNGFIDARDLDNPKADLSLKANNIEIINTSRSKNGSNVYGKALIDLDATVYGDMTKINVTTDINMLSGTNVTYIMQDATQTFTSQSDDEMVRFIQFNDTTTIIQPDSIVSTAMAMDLTARIGIESGATINVDLSPSSSDKVHLMPSGNLVYTTSELNGERMTGRINVNSGFVRYVPPFMSEKNFSFQEGSYIAFNGDMMNPALNIHALDVVKANVTSHGQNSRLVNFDIDLSVTNTLNNMNVAFDLSTDDDITVQNELASMSAEQRANQAMNMLLYNVYTGVGSKGNGNLSGNQLYSFLTSRLNSWAANNIRGVDISFGIDQYDKTTDGSTSTATSYSYRVSKTFFDDRFKIVVGGNYSTDADTDENFSQNLINDISFEYMLNRSGSMYLKIFRHTGYESILEGEITQTGLGFVLKRKLNTLWNLFGIRKEKQQTTLNNENTTK